MPVHVCREEMSDDLEFDPDELLVIPPTPMPSINVELSGTSNQPHVTTHKRSRENLLDELHPGVMEGKRKRHRPAIY